MVIPLQETVSQDCRIVAKIPTPAHRFLNKTLRRQRIFCSLSEGNPQGTTAPKTEKADEAANTYYYQGSVERIDFLILVVFQQQPTLAIPRPCAVRRPPGHAWHAMTRNAARARGSESKVSCVREISS